LSGIGTVKWKSYRIIRKDTLYLQTTVWAGV